MTAEVAVMNRSAVALAADSAMTFGREGEEKIYSTNKIFTLSKFHPIGVMIYNSADYMQVPLETIIKLYRQREWDNDAATVDEHARRFLDFLIDKRFCTDEQITQNIGRIAFSLFGEIYEEIRERLLNAFFASGRIPKRKGAAMLKDAIQAKAAELNRYPDASVFCSTEARSIVRKYQSVINEIIDQTFGYGPSQFQISVSAQNKSSLCQVLTLALTKTWTSDSHSGLVFAGFGTDELFPSLIEIRIDGAIDGKLRFAEIDSIDIDRYENNVCVRAFAQAEMVQRFMDGIDRDLEDYMYMLFGVEIEKFGEKLIDDFSEKTTNEKKKLKRAVSQSIAVHTKALQDAVSRTKHEMMATPIIRAVTNMPKAELAHMAEALVNLTSVKRRVSTEKETVGGPVDVAVISKQDGFVWIRRKHYFDFELNRDFAHKYFQHGGA